MHPSSRPPNRPDGATAVTATQRSGGDPPPVGAAAAQNSGLTSDCGGERSFGRPESTGGGEPDSTSWCRTQASSPGPSLGVFRTRSIFRRPSSGYFSYDGDSQPSSPLSPRPQTADKATQTASPTGQVMEHALRRAAEAHGGGPGTQTQQHGASPSPSSTRQPNAAGDMQTEAIGRELRRIGDDFNRLLLLRGMPGGHRRVVIHPNPLPHLHHEPTVLLCVGVLLLLIGRIIYLQGSTSSQDHSQV